MSRKLCLIALCLLIVAGHAHMQDALNLPTELYVLTNSGTVQEYGLGAAGIRQVTPDGTFVVDFGVAPDGNWIAYRTETALIMQDMYSGDSYEVEGAAAGVPPTRGVGDTLAWSPDGDAVAMTTSYGARVYFPQANPPAFIDLREGSFRQLIWSPGGDYLAAEAEQNIWWLYRRDSSNLILTSAIPSSMGLAWISPTELLFAPGEGGLLRMNLAAANQQTLLLDDTWTYSMPYRLKDGTLAVFGRQKEEPELEAGFGRLLGLAPDAPQIDNLGQVPLDLNGLRWAPGGDLLVAFRGGVLALVIPASGQGLTLPIADAVAYSWGPTPLEPVTGVELPADGYFLAQDGNAVFQVWRLPKNGAAPEPVTEAQADVTVYAVSPDGRRVAYASGGSLQIEPTTGSGAAQTLADLGAREVRNLAFSPNSRQVAYDTLSSVDEPEGGIWLAAADGSGEPELIQANGPDREQPTYQPPFYRQPQFSPDGSVLLIIAAQTELTDFQLLDLNSRTLFDVGSFDAAFWLRNGRLFAYGDGRETGDLPPLQPVVVIDPASGQRTELPSLPYPTRIEAAWEIAAGQVRLLLGTYQRGPNALRAVDLNVSTGEQTLVAEAGFITDPVLSPDGAWVAGQTHRDGPLTFRELASGQQVLLTSLPAVKAFQW